MESYKTYCIAVGELSWNGDKLKSFNELPENIKNAWQMVQDQNEDIIGCCENGCCQHARESNKTTLEKVGPYFFCRRCVYALGKIGVDSFGYS
ncbi:MAG: hypothetical protein JKY54_16465 [Flavobacteriales bacterium]|nr:hypothetical protein [Flavobacteriales bacterium]